MAIYPQKILLLKAAQEMFKCNFVFTATFAPLHLWTPKMKHVPVIFIYIYIYIFYNLCVCVLLSVFVLDLLSSFPSSSVYVQRQVFSAQIKLAPEG